MASSDVISSIFGWVIYLTSGVTPGACLQALDNSGTRVAVGGEGCHLQIWSLAEEQGLSEVFKAKGTKPNKVRTGCKTM